MKICKQCGNEFNPYNNLHVFCSVECQRQYWYKNPKHDPCICKYCGKKFTPKAKDRTTYCSRECAFKYRRANSNIKAKPVNPKQVCAICGKEFEGQGNTKYCSDECIKEKNRLRSYQQSVVEKECGWCGKQFVPGYKSGNYSYCCDEHKRLAKARQRREMKKNNPNAKLHKGGVSRAKRLRIWHRDNDTCQLCGKKMMMDKVNTIASGKPHPLAPTVDHIIPVSIARQYGWDNIMINAESNLQAAHFICNVIKGNRVAGERLKSC